MESNQRPGSSQGEPHNGSSANSWGDDSPTQHVERVTPAQSNYADDHAEESFAAYGTERPGDFADERPEFVPYEPDGTAVRADVDQARGTNPWAIVAAIFAALLAVGAGIWAYVALTDGGDTRSSADSSQNTTVMVSPGPATTEEPNPADKPPTDESPAGETSDEASEQHSRQYPQNTDESAPTIVTFDEGEGVEPVRPDPVEPAPQPQQTSQSPTSERGDAEDAGRAPSSALQCAANVNWRVFSTTGNGGCDNAEAVAIAMAEHSGSGQQSVEVPVPAAQGDAEATATCQLVGGNSYQCQSNGVTVFLEDRAVRD